MAKLLTKRGADKILRRIMETGGMTPDMEKDVERLRAEFDEREGMLSKVYGERYDGEDVDEYEWEMPDRNNARNDDDIIWKKKYDDMVTRYNDRFFGTDEIRDDARRIERSQDEDVERDGKKQTFEDLLKDVED